MRVIEIVYDAHVNVNVNVNVEVLLEASSKELF